MCIRMNSYRIWVGAILTSFCLMTTALANPAFPNKPIKIVIGFPAGGPLDAHIRLLTDRLQAALGQSIVIDYKAGSEEHHV